jgi:hypothetical protein
MSRSVKQEYPPKKWQAGDKVAMIPHNGGWLAVDPKALSPETLEANNGFITTVVEDK